MKKGKTIKVISSLITSILLFSCAPSAPEHVHTFSTEWSHDETYHWHNSTCGHDVTSDKEEHTYTQTTISPTYESDGYIKYTCSVCGYFYTEKNADKLEHHYSSDWSHDETNHWHACTDEGYETLKIDDEEHTFGDWVNDREASPTQEGLRHSSCEKCGYTISETFPYVPSVAAERVYLATSATEIFTGNSFTINPVVIPEEAYHNVKYEVKDSTVVSVENSVATGLKQGTTLVYAYNDENNNDKRDTDEAFGVMAFSIKDGDPSINLEIDDSDLSMKVGDTKRLTYNVIGATPSGLDYGFYSDNEEVCTVSAGNVKAHKAGKANISVTWQGYRDTVEITVSDLIDEKGLRASGIRFEDESIVMTKGQNKNISYSILPEGAVDKIKTFVSNNEEAVTVDNNGQLTALKGGSAIITLTTENDKVNRILVTVKDETETYDSCYNNYYGNLTWENGEDLKAKLHAIISKDVTPLKYDAPNWETNQYADQDLYDFAYLDAVYTDSPILKTETNSSWQREHGFAASLMTGFSTGSAVKNLGRATDFHNLFASHAGTNGSRGNKNLGYANPDNADYATKEECSYVRKSFEPGDNDKGRLARAIFYMSVMYNEIEETDISETWTFRGDDIDTHSTSTKSLHINSKELPLQIVEPNVDYNRISLNEFMYPTKTENTAIVNYYRSLVDLEDSELKDDDYDLYRQKAYEIYLNSAMPYSIGYLSNLLKWNSYSVDLLEMQHNDSVYTHNSSQGRGTQGNRNPFVDYPQLVDYIFGDLKDQPGSLVKLIPSYISLKMNKDEIHHYASDSTNPPVFNVGDKPTAQTLGIKAIKNDLSEGTVDYTKISVPDYTFVDDDVINGKTIEVTTDKNTLSIKAKVVGGSAITFDSATWNYSAPGSNAKDAYSGSNGVFVGDLNGLTFDVVSSNTSITLGNRNTDKACRFGTTSVYCGTLSFTTKSEINFSGKTKVNAVFFNVACGSSKTFKYTISVGEKEIDSGTCSGSFTDYSVILDDEDALTGKVSIVFKDVLSYIDVKGFAINAIA